MFSYLCIIYLFSILMMMIMNKVKKMTQMLMASSALTLLLSCSTDEDPWGEWIEDITNGGTWTGGTGSTTAAGDVATFDIELNTSSLTETETVPTDDNDYVEQSSFSKFVEIVFSGNNASFTGDVDGVSITVSGADVVVNSTTDAVAYTLKGTTTDGSLKIYSDKKFKLELSGVSITNPTAAAINIQSKKRVFVVLADGTENNLTDGSTYTDTTDGEDMKACLFSEGQLIFSGSGTLNVEGNCKAGIRSDDYIVVRPGVNIYVKTTAGNGIKANDYLDIRGGVINVEATAAGAKALSSDGYVTVSGGRTTAITTGNATLDSDSNELTGSTALKADSTLTVTGGELYLKSTGNGGKGISTDMQTYIQGGTVAVITTGKTFTYNRDDTKAKGIKADGDIVVTGGSLKVRASGGDGSEGIESKAVMTIEGGTTEVYAYDDALNSKGNMYVNDGLIFAQSINNDALDANKNLYIEGGTTIALGAGTPENALDAAEGYSIFINGGNVFGIGGSTAQTSSSSKQASIAFNASVSDKKIGLFDSGDNALMYFEVPSTSLTAVYMTTSGMTAGQSYTVKSGVSLTSGTTWNGINIGGTLSGGNKLTTATSALQVGTGMGGGMTSGGGRGPGGW